MNTVILEKKARWVRLEVLDKIYKTGKGHLGGTYSCVDILVALYYGGVLNPHDKFILSKGHACLALYAIFFDQKIISKKEYISYGKNGGLGGQLDVSLKGIDFNTGSLGHSIGVGSGMAYGFKMNKKNNKVITLIGDSEFFEGSIWEAIIFAADRKLNNLLVIIDRNRLTVTNVLDDEGPYFDFKNKIQSFGWKFLEINGHDFPELLNAFSDLENSQLPTLIVANTQRGKGISFVENNIEWYTRAPNLKEYKAARKQLT